MKTLIVLASLFACSMASYYHSHLLAAPVAVPAAVPVATAWTATVPQSRFTRTDWIQPGVQYTIPAVAKYHSITPGFTSYHPAVAPVLAAAPLVHHAPLLAPAAPLFHGHAAHLIKK